MEKQLRELLESFSNYKAGHLRDQLDTDLKDKKDFKKETHVKGNFHHDSRRSHSPGWGKNRKEETPLSSDWDSKGERSASDFGWGPTRNRQRDKSRTPPRDDKRFVKPQSRRGERNDSWNGKRRGSPSRDSHSANKRLPQKEEWQQKGRLGASQWTGTAQVRTYIRSKGISDTQNLIARLKEAKEYMQDLFFNPYIHYHLRVFEEPSKYISLNKELGILGVKEENGRTVSLNFYYGHILKMCHDHLNRLNMKEATDGAMVSIFDEVVERNKKETNAYERYDDSYIVSSYLSTLSEHSRERIDHRKAGLRLWLQENDMQEYHQRRYDFFEKVFLKRDMSDLGTFTCFMDREDILEINEDMNNLRNTLGRAITKPAQLFKKTLYAKAYKKHYEEIRKQIEAYAAYGTKID